MHLFCRSASTLESAIELAVSGSTILLNSGAHCINQSLEFSMSIIGESCYLCPGIS